MGMNPIGSVRLQNLERLIAELGSLERVAAAGNTTSVYLSQLRRGAVDRKTMRPREMGSTMARRLETACGKPFGWMDQVSSTAETAPRLWGATPLPIEPLPVSNAPKVTWGEQSMHRLPATFSTAIPDDSMAPRVRRGDIVRFSRDTAPRPGDGVLLTDTSGNWFFRIYRERRPGEWEAHPLNDAYQPMDGKEDKLQILAVLIGIEEQRWG